MNKEATFSGNALIEVDPSLQYLIITLPIDPLTEEESNKIHKKEGFVCVKIMA